MAGNHTPASLALELLEALCAAEPVDQISSVHHSIPLYSEGVDDAVSLQLTKQDDLSPANLAGFRHATMRIR